ncbi:MAG TPA: peptidylprolyl isomerase [Acidobacteriota bacterium]|nr:peptidylprolyl isomerase [Acidobacteriota bacterium]HRR26397.1 peptidylprolyl isomerase [Acidobacteriota bacterium]HRR56816.1 peptidylprolyl isomerase [Acidobacteriota bacterium]HRV08000.1 peptidylprolyl isomerase [Acidobacteriota bacterium]
MTLAISKDCRVTIHYELKVDGETLDSTLDSDPITYVHGRGQIIPGLEEELQGRQSGEELHVVVPPEKAYGAYSPENLHDIAKSAFVDPDAIQPGMYVEGRTRLGAPFQAKVTEEREESFVIDLNHPLAGKYLEFEVRVVDVAPPEENVGEEQAGA